MPLDSPLVHRARELARLAHADHVRKAPRVPYFEHLDGVARILAAHGVDDDAQLAAAYLHDLLEDRPAFAKRLRAEMPPGVVRLVEVLTERKTDGGGRRREKRARFADYVAGLRADTPEARRARPISCADKIHNTRSLVEAERAGHALLLKLSTRPGEHESQLATLRAVYEGSVPAELLATFDEAARALVDTVEAWLPGRAVLISATAHLGQLDANGEPWVYHPLRLALRADSPHARMVGALHDVVERGGWRLRELAREGFPPAVVRAVDHLTRRPDESDEAFVERASRDRLATQVLLLDLQDRAHPARPTDAERARSPRLRAMMARLERELRKRTLWIALDDESVRALRARAVHPVVRADHVTLAHRVDAEAVDVGALLPDGVALDAPVELAAVAEHRDDRVQALVVRIDGASERPADGGTLHVTVSRAPEARSKDANALLERTPGEPLDPPLRLRGHVEWVDR
ncbi:MAG TPA: HD domain-containing protein [Sandaracinaceae bacterium LLY-WYZ-13_1]|nr:HD domain-containing protein [Sandaracinaceae bacterium LLY-WYZ-13_1]